MGKAKVFFQALVNVPETMRREMIGAIREHVNSDGLDLTEGQLADHPGVDKYIRTTLAQELEQYATELDVWDLIDTDIIRKLLKTEYKAAEKLREEEEERLVLERAEAARVNKEEEERLRKEGRSLVVPLKDSNKAEAILRAAGINVKLLP